MIGTRASIAAVLNLNLKHAGANTADFSNGSHIGTVEDQIFLLHQRMGRIYYATGNARIVRFGEIAGQGRQNILGVRFRFGTIGFVAVGNEVRNGDGGPGQLFLRT